MAKVRIKGVPKNIKPLYKQDPTTYALEAGPVFFQDDKDVQEFRTQYPEVDEDEANIEVEAGEHILTPDMENFSIGGKKHSQGGTFIDADPGSFIFSDHKSLKIKGEPLKEFGINPDTKRGKKGFTPAEIAKKYNTNKMLAILRDKNSDKLDKETASLSLGGMTNKLSKLALMQEAMKGFPQGIPTIAEDEMEDDMMEGEDMMKKGGYYQTGGQTGWKRRPRTGNIDDWVYDENAIDQEGNPGAWVRRSENVQPVSEEPVQSSGQTGWKRRPRTGNVNDWVYDENAVDQEGNPGAWVRRSENVQPVSEEPVQSSGQTGWKRRPRTGNVNDWVYDENAVDQEGNPGAWVKRSGDGKRGSGQTGWKRRPRTGDPKKWVYNEKGIDEDGNVGAWEKRGDDGDGQYKTLPEVVLPPGIRKRKPGPQVSGVGNVGPIKQSDASLTTYEDPLFDTGYGSVDYMNMAAPFAVGLKKYPPIRINVNAPHLDDTLMDLEAQRQAIRGQGTLAMAANNMFAGSASMASARNAQILGQTLDPLNQSFLTEFNTNQQSRAQRAAKQAELNLQADTLNAAADDQYNERTAAMNQTFDDEKRLRLKQFMKSLNAAERSRQMRNAANVINQDYIIDAEGMIRTKPGSNDPMRRWLRITGSNEGMAGASLADQFEAFKQSLPPGLNMTDEKAFDYFYNKNRSIVTGKDAFGNTVSQRNPFLSPANFPIGYTE